jgi:hypothetical protein
MSGSVKLAEIVVVIDQEVDCHRHKRDTCRAYRDHPH